MPFRRQNMHLNFQFLKNVLEISKKTSTLFVYFQSNNTNLKHKMIFT